MILGKMRQRSSRSIESWVSGLQPSRKDVRKGGEIYESAAELSATEWQVLMARDRDSGGRWGCAISGRRNFTALC